MKFNNRMLLFFVFLGVFVLFLASLAALVFYVISNPDKLDPAMTMFAGIGGGLVLEFFLAMLTLSWQFYWRKPSQAEKTDTTTS